MKIRAISAGVLFAAVLAACLELFAGIVVFKDNSQISGRVLQDADGFVLLGYRGGRLAVSKKYVERVVEVRDLSEYGRQQLPPTNEELSALENLFLSDQGLTRQPGQKPLDATRPSTLMHELRTARHILKGGDLEFSFVLPANWKKSDKNGILVFSSPGKKNRASVCAAVLKTPPVSLEKQAQLTEAAAKTHLSGFAIIYSITRQPQSETGEYTMLGACALPGGKSLANTVLRRTKTHTFILTLVLPLQLYEKYSSALSLCRESARLGKAEK